MMKKKKNRWVVLIGLIHLGFGLSQSSGQITESIDQNNENPISIEPTITPEMKKALQLSAPLIKAGRVEEAIELLESLEVENAALEFVKGNLKSTHGKQEDSLDNYNRAIELFPDFQRAYREEGIVQVDLGYFEGGRKNLAKSLELGGRNGKGYGYLAKANLNLKDFTAAEIYFRKALEYEPEKEEWQNGLQKTLSVLGKEASLPEIYASSSSIYEADEVSSLPSIHSRDTPKYPGGLFDQQAEGIVVLRVFLDEKGKFVTVFVERSDHPAFSESAINSFLNWRFYPALLKNEAVKVSFTVRISFQISNVSVSITGS